MINIQSITDDLYWVGANDRRLRLFENLFPLPDGVAYNSYLLLDDKTVLFDTADNSVADQYLSNVRYVLGMRDLDYLVIHHMEPDHCAMICSIVGMYPNVTLVGNEKTFEIMYNFYPGLKDVKKMVVKEGDVLETGSHSYEFFMTSMIHWPEVMMSYDEEDGVLFTADAFGTFGAFHGTIFADEYDFEKDFLDEARRYYSNIVGKYGEHVQAALYKLQDLDIQFICSLHGPVWRSNIDWFLDKYKKWSRYEPEDDDIVVIYGSMYGNTASAADRCASMLREKSGKNIRVYDVAETDASYLVSEVWRCNKIVLFCPTYNGSLYLLMENFIHEMEMLHVQNRTFGLAQNGAWSPTSGRIMVDRLSSFKDCRILDPLLTINGAMHQTDETGLEAFTDAVVEAE